jgi:hypothetical protein
MSEEQSTFEYRLDFLYQSIAIYAGTLVVYLLVRGEFVSKEFPVAWQDPLVALLSFIILLSIGGLIYNAIMRRRMEIVADQIHFRSAIREKVIPRSDVVAVIFSRERGRVNRGARVIRLRLKSRRRPVRIHPLKFTNSKELTQALRTWAGPLAVDRASLRPGTRGSTAQG